MKNNKINVFEPIFPYDRKNDKVIMSNFKDHSKDMVILTKDFRAKSGTILTINAPKDKILYTYLKQILLTAWHPKPEIIGSLSLQASQEDYARETCKNLEFIKNNKLTNRGIEFLRFYEQNEINKSMKFATWTLAIGTGLLAFFTLLNLV